MSTEQELAGEGSLSGVMEGYLNGREFIGYRVERELPDGV
jgi:hypothetical protein